MSDSETKLNVAQEAYGRIVALEQAVIPILCTLLADPVRGETLPELLASIEEMRHRARAAARSMASDPEMAKVTDHYVETLFDLVASTTAAAAFDAGV